MAHSWSSVHWVALTVVLLSGCFRSNHMRGTVKARIQDSGVQYVGIEPASETAPTESREPVGDLLLRGYAPIGFLQSVARRGSDTVHPLRGASSRFRGELYTIIAANIPTDGEMRIRGTACVSKGATTLSDTGVAGADMAFAAGLGTLNAMDAMLCGPPTKMDFKSWAATTTSLALVWEKHPELDSTQNATYSALHHALVTESHPGAIATFGARFDELCVARGQTRARAKVAATGHSLTGAQRQELEPVLAAALARGDAELAGWLVAGGVDPGPLPLHAAAGARMRDVADALLAADVPPDHKDSEGRGALHLAVQRPDVNLVRALLDHRADPNLTNRARETPLRLAVAANHVILARLLLERGANPKIEPRKQPGMMELATGRCSCTLADELAAAGARGRPCDAGQRTRGREGFERIVTAIKEVMANNDPLHRVSAALPEQDLNGCVDLALSGEIESLIALAQRAKRIDWLLDFFARGIPLGDITGVHPGAFLTTRQTLPASDVFLWSLDHGLDLDARDDLGDTAFLTAARRLESIQVQRYWQNPERHRWLAILRKLLARGADPSFRNAGKSAWDLLKTDPEAAQLLTSHGAGP